MKRLILTVATLLFLLVPVSASAAYNPFGTACKVSGGGGSTACSANGANDPISGPNGILKKVSLILATISSIAAVIIIIVAGLSYVTSNGDPSKIASARGTITGAVVGLVIIISAESIILFVVSKL
jgi:hypothetical protein